MQDLEKVRQRLRDFAKVRDWDQFHSSKNLSMALSVEASELVECFQWLTEEQSRSLTPKQLAAVTDEIADVQLYLIRLADKVGVILALQSSKRLQKTKPSILLIRSKGALRNIPNIRRKQRTGRKESDKKLCI